MRIVIAGPPHSGKSVFIGGLTANLPRDMRYLFRACPDGEGTWTYRGNGSEKYRRKGSFTQDNVDWYITSLQKADALAPLCLVDVGGRTSEENYRILTEGKVRCGIILAGDLSRVPEWEEFFLRCGVKTIAVVHSDYNGEQDDTSASPMVVHHLERGEDVSSRPVIKTIAAMLLDMVENPKKEVKMLSGNKISIPALATELGKEKVKMTLPNGREVETIVWEGSDLPLIARLLHNHSGEMPEVVDIDGAAPGWLVAALSHECHPRGVRVNSPDGYVAIGVQRPDGQGSGPNLIFSVEEKGHVTWVTCQQADPSIPLSPDDLDHVVPPSVPMGAVVVLSGRMPNWLLVSLAMAYHGQAKAVACFQPGTGSTVCWTHSQKVALGSVIA